MEKAECRVLLIDGKRNKIAKELGVFVLNIDYVNEDMVNIIKEAMQKTQMNGKILEWNVVENTLIARLSNLADRYIFCVDPIIEDQ